MKNNSKYWIVTDLDGTLMDENYDISPARLKFGFAYKNKNFNYGLDYERQSTDRGRIMTGLEYNKDIYNIPISLSIGGRSNVIDDPSGWEIKNSLYVTSGIGIQLKIFKNNNIRVKILLIEFINNLLSTLFLSANRVTIELCNGPLIPPKRTKKNPGII